ncbi:MCE family protein [Nocardioides sp.]|uniref:MCE family protein n=1 Tax=Nocardioides sp. TaxID=35761 RepID=UPI0039E2EA76
MSRAVDIALGAFYFVLVAALLGVAVLVYNKAFTDHTDVKLTTGALGNAIQQGSDVKLHGVPVGSVRHIEPTSTGAELTLALDPSALRELPADTTARLLPKTLFGERYVSLVTPDATTPGLRGGDVIHEDTSAEAVELQDVLDQLLPLLRSIQPEKLAASLGELATMLRGQGAEIGTSLAAWGDYLAKLNPLVPQMADDFAALGTVANQYAAAVPDLLDALDTMTATSATLVDEQDQLASVFATVIDAADTTRGWTSANDKTIRILSKQSRKALRAVAPYATEFPCLLKAASDFVPVMDKTLGAGTDEPGVHVVLNVVPSRGKYLAGTDVPTQLTGGGPRCPYVTGQTGTQPVSRSSSEPETIPAPPTQIESRIASADGDLGEDNSPAENELIAELVGPTQGIAPSDYPDWASLLLGPTLRGAEVTIQ